MTPTPVAKPSWREGVVKWAGRRGAPPASSTPRLLSDVRFDLDLSLLKSKTAPRAATPGKDKNRCRLMADVAMNGDIRMSRRRGPSWIAGRTLAARSHFAGATCGSRLRGD
jgi:hypothetical protein